MGTRKTFTYKLVLLGDAGVGKTALAVQFVKGQFNEFTESTIGASFMNQTLNLQDGTVVKYQIWDTAGQERFHSLAPMYYRGAQAALVVYDLTDDNSFQKAKLWVKELQVQGDPNVVIVLVGNKLDKEQFRKVQEKEAKSYAESQQLLFIETSAKNGANITELFTRIAKQLPKTQKQGTRLGEPTTLNGSLALDPNQDPNNTKNPAKGSGGGCCS